MDLTGSMSARKVVEVGPSVRAQRPARRIFDALVVGAGQAGLACGHFLAQDGLDFTILDSAKQVGGSWADRWDSLRLITPSALNSLPGFPFPATTEEFPSKDSFVRYLAAYAAHFDLPVRLGSRVERIERKGGIFEVRCGDREIYAAHSVVVASGAFQRPFLPPLASALDPGIVQLHSARYRNPSTLAPGSVLVVGSGNSGAQLAYELSQSGRRVWLAGANLHLPRRVFGRDLFWWLARTGLLTADLETPMGRWITRRRRHSTDPIIGLSRRELGRVGVRSVGRNLGVKNGRPTTDGGRVLDAEIVLWATGFRPDFRWIRGLQLDDRGFPVQSRGLAQGLDGLYFLGLKCMTCLGSGLIGGVAGDARWVATSIRERVASINADVCFQPQ